MSGVTGKQCSNVAPEGAGEGYAGLRCMKIKGHPLPCKVSPDGIHSFSWNPAAFPVRGRQ